MRSNRVQAEVEVDVKANLADVKRQLQELGYEIKEDFSKFIDIRLPNLDSLILQAKQLKEVLNSLENKSSTGLGTARSAAQNALNQFIDSPAMRNAIARTPQLRDDISSRARGGLSERQAIEQLIDDVLTKRLSRDPEIKERQQRARQYYGAEGIYLKGKTTGDMRGADDYWQDIRSSRETLKQAEQDLSQKESLHNRAVVLATKSFGLKEKTNKQLDRERQQEEKRRQQDKRDRANEVRDLEQHRKSVQILTATGSNNALAEQVRNRVLGRPIDLDVVDAAVDYRHRAVTEATQRLTRATTSGEDLTGSRAQRLSADVERASRMANAAERSRAVIIADNQRVEAREAQQSENLVAQDIKRRTKVAEDIEEAKRKAADDANKILYNRKGQSTLLPFQIEEEEKRKVAETELRRRAEIETRYGRGTSSPYGNPISNFQRLNATTTNVARLAGYSLAGLGSIGAIAGFTKSTIESDVSLEKTKLALAGIINQYTTFLNIQSKAVSPQVNLNRAIAQSNTLYEQLRNNAMKYGETAQEMSTIFAQSGGVLMSKGMTSGMSLDIVSKMSAIGRLEGFSDTSIGASISGFGAGIIQRRNRLLVGLGFTPEGLKAAKEQGPQAQYEYAETALKKWEGTLERYANTTPGLLNRLSIQFEKTSQSFGATIAPVLIPALASAGKSFQQWVDSGKAKEFASSTAELVSSFIGVTTRFLEFVRPFVSSIEGVLIGGFIGVLAAFVIKARLQSFLMAENVALQSELAGATQTAAAEAQAGAATLRQGAIGIVAAIALIVTGIIEQQNRANNSAQKNVTEAYNDYTPEQQGTASEAAKQETLSEIQAGYDPSYRTPEMRLYKKYSPLISNIGPAVGIATLAKNRDLLGGAGNSALDMLSISDSEANDIKTYLKTGKYSNTSVEMGTRTEQFDLIIDYLKKNKIPADKFLQSAFAYRQIFAEGSEFTSGYSTPEEAWSAYEKGRQQTVGGYKGEDIISRNSQIASIQAQQKVKYYSELVQAGKMSAIPGQEVALIPGIGNSAMSLINKRLDTNSYRAELNKRVKDAYESSGQISSYNPDSDSPTKYGDPPKIKTTPYDVSALWGQTIDHRFDMDIKNYGDLSKHGQLAVQALTGKLTAGSQGAVETWRKEMAQAGDSEDSKYATQVANIKLTDTLDKLSEAYTDQLRKVEESNELQRQQNEELKLTIDLKRQELGLGKLKLADAQLNTKTPEGFLQHLMNAGSEYGYGINKAESLKFQANRKVDYELYKELIAGKSGPQLIRDANKVSEYNTAMSIMAGNVQVPLGIKSANFDIGRKSTVISDTSRIQEKKHEKDEKTDDTDVHDAGEAALTALGKGVQKAAKTVTPHGFTFDWYGIHEVKTPKAVEKYTGANNLGLDSDFYRRLQELSAATGVKLQFASTHRDYDKQKALRKGYLDGRRGIAAPPGSSWHEHNLNGMPDALAADIHFKNSTDKQKFYNNASKFNLGFPLGSKDPNHIQPFETYGKKMSVWQGKRVTSSGVGMTLATSGGSGAFIKGQKGDALADYLATVNPELGVAIYASQGRDIPKSIKDALADKRVLNELDYQSTIDSEKLSAYKNTYSILSNQNITDSDIANKFNAQSSIGLVGLSGRNLLNQQRIDAANSLVEQAKNTQGINIDTLTGNAATQINALQGNFPGLEGLQRLATDAINNKLNIDKRNTEGPVTQTQITARAIEATIKASEENIKAMSDAALKAAENLQKVGSDEFARGLDRIVDPQKSISGLMSLDTFSTRIGTNRERQYSKIDESVATMDSNRLETRGNVTKTVRQWNLDEDPNYYAKIAQQRKMGYDTSNDPSSLSQMRSMASRFPMMNTVSGLADSASSNAYSWFTQKNSLMKDLPGIFQPTIKDAQGRASQSFDLFSLGIAGGGMTELQKQEMMKNPVMAHYMSASGWNFEKGLTGLKFNSLSALRDGLLGTGNRVVDGKLVAGSPGIIGELGGNLAGNMIGSSLFPHKDPAAIGMGTQLGGALLGATLSKGLGAIGSFAGPAGTILGSVVGGLLGGLFGGKREDPNAQRLQQLEQAQQQRMVDLLDHIDKSLRPSYDFYRSIRGTALFGDSAMYYSGRSYNRLGLFGSIAGR